MYSAPPHLLVFTLPPRTAMALVSKLQSSILRIIRDNERQSIAARFIRPGLSLASSMYSIPVRARNYLYDRSLLRVAKLPAPVISVGNITVGGAGKTPMVEWIADHLRGKGIRSAILSRGYGAQRKGSGHSVADSPGRINDEFLMLSENLGMVNSPAPNSIVHLAGPDRARLGAEAIEKHNVQCIILDDGFQHRRLHRDLDIVLIDCLSPFGFDRTLPRGLLREPLSELRRARLFVLSRTDQCSPGSISEIREKLRRFNSKAPVVETVHKPLQLASALTSHLSDRETSGEQTRTVNPDQLAGRDVYAFCGIGNPEAFRRSLSALNARIVSFRVFPDHYRYSDKDIREIVDGARESEADMMITTQKDSCRLRQQNSVAILNRARFDVPLLTLKVILEVTRDRETLTEAIERCVIRGS